MSFLLRLRFLRRLGGTRRVVAARAGFVLALAVIEVLGRRSASDVHDLLGVFALVGVAGAWLALDGAARDALARRALRLFERAKALVPAFGLDLRGEPVVPRDVPALVRGAGALCAILTALELLWILLVGTPFRAFAAQGSYVLLLALTAALWAALLATILLSVVLVALVVVGWLRVRYGDRPLGRLRGLWIAGHLAGAALGLAFAPAWVPLLLLGAAVLWLAAAESVHRLPRLPVLWREPEGRLGAFDLDRWITAQSVLVWWPAGLLVVAALGGRALGLPAGGATPVTDTLGIVCAWLVGPAALFTTAFQYWLLRLMVRADPAEPCPTSVHLAPEGGDERRARALLEARGWRVRAVPAAPERADVRLRVVARMEGGRVTWPLAVSAAALKASELLDVIARRDVVQRRRLLLRGLEKMLKRARRRAYAAGTGFWIAPQHWFAAGLTRDTEEEDAADPAIIGDPYHMVIPHAARHHAYQVFAGVEVDLVFVEDGVQWRGLRRVLGRLFAHYDARAGRIEERHLSGLPGLRVILHDFRLGEPLRRERYPEPDYEDLGRARVLHVFRDRGGEDEPERAPAPGKNVPVRA